MAILNKIACFINIHRDKVKVIQWHDVALYEITECKHCNKFLDLNRFTPNEKELIDIKYGGEL